METPQSDGADAPSTQDNPVELKLLASEALLAITGPFLVAFAVAQAIRDFAAWMEPILFFVVAIFWLAAWTIALYKIRDFWTAWNQRKRESEPSE